MTQFLPPNLLALFQARPPIPYLPPPDLKKRKLPQYLGVSACLAEFEDPSETPPPQPPRPDTKETRKKRKREDKDTANQQRITEQLASCKSSPPRAHLNCHLIDTQFGGQGTHTRTRK
jgi:U1 small nuclear ribonucleoprotein